MRFIGIDPGASGGIAWIDEDGNADAFGFTRKTEGEIADMCKMLDNGTLLHETVATIEWVHAMPSDGKTQAFAFGQSLGLLRGMMAMTSIPLGKVDPMKWKRHFDLIVPRDKALTESKHKTRKKNLDKAKSIDLFPSLKITHSLADALLIAEYTRQYH